MTTETTSAADTPQVGETDGAAPEADEQIIAEGDEQQPGDEGEQTEQQEETPAAEPIEINVYDNKFSIPPGTPADVVEKLKEFGENVNKGVTGKFQQAAELRRQAETQRQEAQQQIQAAQACVGEIARLQGLTDQLAQYEQVDWSTWIDSDPLQAKEAYKQWEALKIKRSQAEDALHTKLSGEAEKQKAALEKLREDGAKTIAEKIPDWSDSKATAVGKFVSNQYGYAPHELQNVLDPRLVLMMHDAMLYREALKKATAPAKSATPKPVPVTKVGASAQASKDPDKMSAEEWRKWRDAQVYGKSPRK